MFGLFAVIDGVRVILDDDPDVELFIGGVRVGEEYLHDTFRSFVDAIEYGDSQS